MVIVRYDDLIKKFPENETWEEILDSVFNSLCWEEAKDGVMLDRIHLSEWKNRDTHEIEKDWICLEIHREEIILGFELYLDHEEFSCKEMDWLFLNLLMYAEYLTTINGLRLKFIGLEQVIKMKCSPPSKEHFVDVTPFVHRWWHLPMNMFFFLLSFIIFPIGPILYGFSYFSRRKKGDLARAKLNATLQSMLHSYLSINSLSLGWFRVRDILNDSAQKGAIWNSSLFNLVDNRIHEGKD